jgi:hypothetical protein
MTTTVSNIEHLESVSLRGTSVIKLYFQPNADVNASIAQVTAICQTLLKPLPPGITPPLILQYNAADVPVLMISLGSDQLAEQEISDLGNNPDPAAPSAPRPGAVGPHARPTLCHGTARLSTAELVVSPGRQDGSHRDDGDQQQPGCLTT